MGKFIGGIVVGVLVTFIVWFGIFIYGQATRPLLNRIYVVENYETGSVTVCGGYSVPRVSIAPDGKPSFIARRDNKGHLFLEAQLTPDITIEHAWLERNRSILWNGMTIPDEAGQQWEHVGTESHHTAYREKYGEDIALAQCVWIGRMYTDGKDVFFEDVYNGEARSKWRKLSNLTK